MRTTARVRTVAVVAHSKKSFGGGLPALRHHLTTLGLGVEWFEVRKSKLAPKAAKRALATKPDVLFVWGGDGTVQRCIDVVAGSGVPVAILPAGTANLLATSLGIPDDLEDAVAIGLHGRHRALDVGRINGERFAVMAGCGFDAMMIEDADGSLKDRFGRAAYVLAGAKNLRTSRVNAEIDVDGRRWFSGKVSCVLVGNIGSILGGVEVFEAAEPDDGVLDVGVVSAKGPVQWTRVLGRIAFGHAHTSPLVEVTAGRRIDVRLSRSMAYELDGGARGTADRLKVRVEPGALTVCVPR